jgi:CubicO group peptidase (beta-lactamase class C family)
MEQYHFPGLSTCIVKDGEIIHNGSYGFANFVKNREVTDSTTFVLASISKTITATAIMQLWEDGLFGLDDNINDYLPSELQIINPWFPVDPITFRQLLTHTSSIDMDWNLIYSLWCWGCDSPIALDSLLVNYFMPGGEYNSWGPFNNWAPGTAYDYSNPAIALTGYLVEVIADTPFADYCQKNIFTPLGMHETSWFLSGLDTNNIAAPHGYTNQYDFYPHYGDPFYPAGMLRTSAVQLARFMTAFMQLGEFDGIRILDSATVELMTTVQFPGIDPYEDFENGFVFGIWNHTLPILGARTLIGHRGSRPGYETGMWYINESGEQCGVIVLANNQPSNGFDGLMAIWDQLAIYGLSYPFVGIAEGEGALPVKYAVLQNYPNPFNPVSTIRYDLPQATDVSLVVYDIMGREVMSLVDSYTVAGNHHTQWNGQDASGREIPSGIYIARLVTPEYSKSIKMVLMK